MRFILPAVALTALIASPALAAGHAPTCSQFIAMTNTERMVEVRRLEPSHIAERGSNTKDSTKASSGPQGTVDPNMMEDEKADRIVVECHKDPSLTTGEAMSKAFP